MPSKYIYEPWKAPLSDQKAAKVRITGSHSCADEGIYPKPMFDFNERRKVCIDGLKLAYHNGLHGNDQSVIDGSWRRMFGTVGEHEAESGGQTDEGASSRAIDPDTLPAKPDIQLADKEVHDSKEAPSRSNLTNKSKRKGIQSTLDQHVNKKSKL
jgi:cryptochrome